MQDTPAVTQVRRKYRSLSVEMDERGRRQWAVAEAQELGWGGVALFGWDALFDNLKVAYDTNSDDAITSADDLVIDEDFSATTVSPTHDDAGNQ